jgi:hypothetical protein
MPKKVYCIRYYCPKYDLSALERDV